MKKIISLFLLIFSLFSFVSPSITYAKEVINNKAETSFPSWEKFTKLKSIVDKYLIEKKTSYWLKYKGNIIDIL